MERRTIRRNDGVIFLMTRFESAPSDIEQTARYSGKRERRFCECKSHRRREIRTGSRFGGATAKCTKLKRCVSKRTWMDLKRTSVRLIARVFRVSVPAWNRVRVLRVWRFCLSVFARDSRRARAMMNEAHSRRIHTRQLKWSLWPDSFPLTILFAA